MPQDQIDEIKEKTDIVSVVSEHIDLKKAGRNYKANCPFHAEKTPSFMVSPDLQIFKCFGCGESGDVIAFLQKYEGMDFSEALKELADKTGVKLKPFEGNKKNEKHLLREINGQALYFYRYILNKHPVGRKALNYLKKERGLTKKSINQFELGYCPDKPFAIKKFLIDKKGYKLDDIRKAGITYERNGIFFDRFRGRVIFPLHDHRGNVIGFAGRIMPTEKNKDLAKYINSPETPVYHKSQVLYGLNFTKGNIKRSKDAVVVEGELDLISSWQIGIRNIVALKGSAFTKEQATLLSRYAESVILAFDSDFAGSDAAMRGIKTAEDEGLEVKVIKLKSFKDPDEAARNNPEKYKKILKKPIGIWDFIIDSIFERFDETTSEGKRKISGSLTSHLADISDSIMRAHYMNMVADKLNVPLEAVMSQVGKQASETNDRQLSKFNPVQKRSKQRRELLEEQLFKLIVENQPKKAKDLKKLDIITSPLYEQLLEELVKYLENKKDFDTSDFANNLPKQLFTGFADLVLNVENDKEPSFMIHNWEEQYEMLINELKVIKTKTELDTIVNKIRETEREGKKKKLEKFEKEFIDVSKRLNKLKKL